MATMLNPNAIPDGSITQEKIDSSVLAGKQDTLQLTVKDNGNIVLANIQGQSKEFMPATPSGDPMHYAYVAAGAEYNDTGADIVKTTPWADLADNDADKTVVHKVGYWYLNGLGDITNEQMRNIYKSTIYFFCSTQAQEVLYGTTARTNINNYSHRNNKGGYSPHDLFAALNGSALEVALLTDSNNKIYVKNWDSFAMGCRNLMYVIGAIKLSSIYSPGSNEFKSCNKLKVVKLLGLKNNISFSDSPLFTSKSILYMIQNEAATSAITITLHADAYARAMANTDIVAALEAHPNVSLASA